MINLEASITGYHNPTKHKDLTPEEFLLLYLRRQARKAWNSKSSDRAVLILEVLKDWDKWIERVMFLFSNTLCKQKK
jgi:hypothetical protein